TGLAKVFKSNGEVSFTNVRLSSENISVDIRIKPLKDQRGKNRLAAVFIAETGRPLIETSPAEEESVTTYDFSREAEQRIKDLEQELQFTRENLQASIEELETSNEELQATNEELLASNEELQSTNEELQSVNEELFTVNAEHQNKITELLETNNDLDNYVNSTDVISVFLDENLDIRRFTHNASLVFNILEQDVGRPFEHISNRMRDIDVQNMIDRVNRTGNIEKKQVFVPAHGWFLLRIRPYMISEMQQSGIVVVLNNIDEIKGLQNDLSDTRNRFEELLKMAGIGTWDWIIEDDSIVCSGVFRTMYGLDSGECYGTYQQFLEWVHSEDLAFVEQAYRKAIDDHTTFSIEHRLVQAESGKEVWVSETGMAEYAEDGTAIKLLGIVREIRER
ncbi:MAG: PAS domain-containing protein, partial [Chromatiales bacterium]|nr:PAS domain-containing protein [Chromatiales bacterium]